MKLIDKTESSILLSDIDLLYDSNKDYLTKITIVERILGYKMPRSFYEGNEEEYFFALKFLFSKGDLFYKSKAYIVICDLIKQGYNILEYSHGMYLYKDDNIHSSTFKTNSPLSFHLYNIVNCRARKHGNILKTANKDDENLDIYCFLECIIYNFKK